MDNKKESKERSQESSKKYNSRGGNIEEQINNKTTFGYWEVQTQMAHTWTNCITEYITNAEADEGYTPKTFSSEFDAQVALNNRLSDETKAFEAGDAGYHPTASKYRLSFKPYYP